MSTEIHSVGPAEQGMGGKLEETRGQFLPPGPSPILVDKEVKYVPSKELLITAGLPPPHILDLPPSL